MRAWVLVAVTLGAAGCGSTTAATDGDGCGAPPEPAVLCLRGTAGHACVRGSSVAQVCSGGRWVCPSGHVAATLCGCDGASPGAACGGCTGAPPEDCASGQAGGACGDTVTTRRCADGAWTCPSGTVPVTRCACVGHAPASGCTCAPSGWACPSRDAGADATSDVADAVARDASDDTDVAAVCDTSVIRMVPPGSTFRVGSYCDELRLCAADAAVAAAVMRVAPAFECAPETGGGVPCAAGEVRCTWRSGGTSHVTVGNDEHAQVCRALAVPRPPRAGLCIVYV